VPKQGNLATAIVVCDVGTVSPARGRSRDMEAWMRALIVSALAVAALTLAACETATPYQPIGAHNREASGGYADQQIEANRWRITFSGNDLTARDTVERYLL